MKNSTVKKINTAGLIGYIISIILIIGIISAMVLIAICTAGAIAVSNNNSINVRVATNINVNSTGNILGILNKFISIDGVKDLNDLTDGTKEINNKNISEINAEQNNEGLNINVKTNEINLSMEKIIVALITAFIFLSAVTVSLYMVKALMKSLKTCETPFSEDIIKNMTRFATSLICVVIINIILNGFWALFMQNTYKISINLESILLIAVIYILITVFKYGADLQHESDETL